MGSVDLSSRTPASRIQGASRQVRSIVRVGPNEVSICDVDAVQVVLGTLPKGHFYEALRDPGKPSNLLLLTGEAHARRRRIWNRGMSTESLADYADLISKRALQLVDRLEHLEGPVDLSAWLSYFSFVFMGDMAFGGGFEMMQYGGDKDGIWEMLNSSLYALLVIAHVVWLSATLQRLPWMTVPIARLRKFGIDNATNQIQT